MTEIRALRSEQPEPSAFPEAFFVCLAPGVVTRSGLFRLASPYTATENRGTSQNGATAMRVNSDVLRRIAGTELDKLFPDTAPRARDDLITAVVRQWITSDGHAGIFTVAMNYWLQFEEFPDERFEVHAEATAPDRLRQLLDSHLAQEDDVPRILRQLTLRQSVVFDNEDATALKICVRPEVRQFEIEPADPEE